MTQRINVWLRALRVNQWTKNGIVFLAWFFAVADPSQAALARGIRPFILVAAMAVAFCVISSAFYLLNDVSDFEAGDGGRDDLFVRVVDVGGHL